MGARIAVVLILLGVPAVSWGADDRGATVGGSVSATNMDAQTDVSFAGSFGFRFSRVVGLEIDATMVPSMTSAFPDDFAVIQGLSAIPAAASIVQIFPVPTFSRGKGRAVIFSNNVRIEIPTSSTRVTPYFVAGGGVASVRRSADITYPIPLILDAIPIPPNVVPPQRQFTQRVVSSSTDLALTLGAGVGIRVASQLFVDADLRLFRFMGDEDRNAGRFGIGIRYQF